MSKREVTKGHRQGQRCQYRDPVTGRQCNNTAQKGHPYCRPCARRMHRSQRTQSVSIIDDVLRNRKLAQAASTRMPAHIQDGCFSFLERLGEHIPISQVVLYGSYAQQRAHTWSDVDLAVVSSEFRGMPFLKRTILLRIVGLTANTPKIQALGLTPREFESGDRPRIVREVRQGIPMFDA